MKPLRILTIIAALISVAFFWPSAALAIPGLTVEGALLVTDVAPGDTLTHKIKVSIAATDSPQDIVARVMEATQNLDGTYKTDSAPDVDSGFSACSYITLSKNSAHLEPGSSEELIATVRVPADAGGGGHYAIINIQTRPVGQGGVGISSAVNVPVYLTVKRRPSAIPAK